MRYEGDTAAVGQRVDRIEALMRELRWEGRKTAKELAAEWGCSLHAVFDASAEASRRIRKDVRETEAVSNTVAVRLDRIVRTGEDRDAVKAADVWSRIVAGVRAPEKSEVAVTTPAAFEALSPEKKLAWIDERIARLQEVRAEVATLPAVAALPEGA